MAAADPSADASTESFSSPTSTPAGENEHSVLCRSDRDCPIDASCCPSGVIGICEPLDPSRGCPEPDLTLSLPTDLAPHFENRIFYEDDCSLQKCLSGRGARRLLRFPMDLANRGDGDMILTLRGAPGVRRIACDDSLFLDDFLRYELLDADGVRRASGVGDIGLTCQNDYLSQSTSPFDCDTLGLEAHSYRTFASSNNCQWVDITTVPPGQYTLRVSVNASSQATEADFGNNVLERPVTIPASDPLAPCEGDVPSDLSFGDGIECGWEFMPGQTGLPCVPGEQVYLRCTFCDGGYLPRACPGLEACSAAASLPYYSIGTFNSACSSDDVCDSTSECTDFPFTCPANGLYTLLGFPTIPLAVAGSGSATAPSTVICRRGEEPVYSPPRVPNPNGDPPSPAGDAGPTPR
jgi:lysyl oxidase